MLYKHLRGYVRSPTSTGRDHVLPDAVPHNMDQPHQLQTGSHSESDHSYNLLLATSVHVQAGVVEHLIVNSDKSGIIGCQ